MFHSYEVMFHSYEVMFHSNEVNKSYDVYSNEVKLTPKRISHTSEHNVCLKKKETLQLICRREIFYHLQTGIMHSQQTQWTSNTCRHRKQHLLCNDS